MHFHTQFTYRLYCVRLLAGAALCGCLLMGRAAQAQTQGPATSFNVLNFGGAASGGDPDGSSYKGDIPPIEYSLLSALNADASGQLTAGGDLGANAGPRLSGGFLSSDVSYAAPNGRRARRMGLAGLNDQTEDEKKSGADMSGAGSFSGGAASGGMGGGGGASSGSGSGSSPSKTSSTPTATGQTQIGFDTITLSGKNPKSNVFNVNASDLAHTGALIVDTPAGSQSTINVLGASKLPDTMPAVSGNTANVGYNLVGADGAQSAGSSVQNKATALDPIAAFGAAGGGFPGAAGGAASSGAKSGAKTGGGGSGGGYGMAGASGGLIPYAGNAGLLDASVLPESPGLLLLCSGLLALAPLAWRRRVQV